jgi:AraC-like DNA-binding protein
MPVSLQPHMAPYEVPVMKNDGPFFRPSILGHEVVRRNFKRRLFHDYSTDAVERMEMILFTVAGHAQVQFSGSRQRLRRGSFLLLGLPCDARILLHEKGCPWEFYYVHVSDPKPVEAFRWLRNQHGNVVHLPTGRSAVPRLAEQSSNLITALRRSSNHNVYACSRHTYDWFLQVAKACQQEQSRTGSLRGVKSVEVSEVAEGCHTIKEYARQLRYSPSYLSRKLAKTWQKSPGEALRTARLEKAASLLKSTDLAVWEVGSRVGYFSTSSFIRAFHGVFGTTPAMFRHNPIDLRPDTKSGGRAATKSATTTSKAKGARRVRA